jgi:peptidyl-prolyl cis-trans isomerase SurA
MYSEDSTQESGGDWGWVDRRALNESLTKIAFSLKPGDVSEVVELAGSYYLLYVEAKKNATSKAMAEVHDDIENKLLAEQRQKAEEKWLDSLRHKAYISIPGITDTEASNTASTQKHPKAP